MYEIDSKYKVSLEGFQEQEATWQCPHCREELNITHVVGFGLYPLGGWHSQMKPNNPYGVGFECPKCFSKSCFHSDKYVYSMYVDNIEFQAKREAKLNNN